MNLVSVFVFPENQWSASGFHEAINEVVNARMTSALVLGKGPIDPAVIRKSALTDWIEAAAPAGNA